MSKLIVEMDMPKNCNECEAKCVSALHGRICGISRKNIMPFLDRPNRPDWCPIKGKLPEEHGDLIDRHKTAEELNQMADRVYEDFPLVDRKILISWDHGIRTAAQFVRNLAGRKDDAVD